MRFPLIYFAMTIYIRVVLVTVIVFCAFAGEASARRGRDSVTIVETPAGRYVCCYDILVTNHTDSATKISEFRFRIVSGRAKFIAGQTDAPYMWTSQQDSVAVAWFSTGAAYDIAFNQTVGGFHICPRDTGVVRFVWETRNVDSLLSTDTVVLACRGIDCDEAFFNPIPSDVSAVVDIDLVAGNRIGSPINDFHIHPLTRGATFKSTPTPTPAGWNRTTLRPDTIVWSTLHAPLNVPDFIESFRFEMDAPRDSVIRMEYWTTTFGDIVCRDTVSVGWGLARRDTVRAVAFPDTCCDDIHFSNTHIPVSTIDLFTVKLTTPGARIVPGDHAPPAWRQVGPNTAGDSIAFVAAERLRFLDSATFRSLCFDNTAATSDTITWVWRAFTRGAVVDQGVGRRICIRPLTDCDSVGVRVDSTYPASERCVYLFLKNANSRNAAITQLTLRFSNPGTARRVRSTNPPPGWQAITTASDSVVFVGNPLVSGDTISPFAVCLSNDDTGSRDPLSIRWATANGLGPICTGIVQTNAVINADCDLIEWAELPMIDSNECCFRIRVLNRNGRNRQIDRLSMTVDLPFIFSDASAPLPWGVDVPAFPSFDVTYVGGLIESDSSSPYFNLCVNMQQVPQRPVSIPVAWMTSIGRSIVCADTVRLVCRGIGRDVCDEAHARGVGDSCRGVVTVVNRHEPPTSIDGIDVHVPPGRTIRAVVGPSLFGQTTFDDTTARIRGGSLPSGDSATFEIAFTDGAGGDETVIIGVTTLEGTTAVCSDTAVMYCATSGAPRAQESAMALVRVIPNPVSSKATVTFELPSPQVVTMHLRDAVGRDVHVRNLGLLTTGPHSIDIDLDSQPSGTYYIVLVAGIRTLFQRVSVAR